MSVRRFLLAAVIALGSVAVAGSARAEVNNTQAALPGWFSNHPELAHQRGLTDYYPGAEQYLNGLSEQLRATVALPAWLIDHPELAQLHGLVDYYPGAAQTLTALNEQSTVSAADRVAPEWFRSDPELAHVKGLADYFPSA
jgi:hypothetical protein